jgi:6-phosphogluconolactonase
MEHFFDNRDEASIAAAARILRNLQARLESQRAASLIVSGGKTPVQCFKALAGSDLDWSRVQVLLSDERYVPPTNADSNERLVRETLLQEHAAAATLWPYYDASTELAERCVTLEDTLRTMPIPFACALLGMGEDGHFASLFPDAGNLAQGLDVDQPSLCLPVKTAASAHPRITLTLAALSRSDEVVLLIFGEAKREVYEQALARDTSLPVAKLLKQKRAPVRVFWAP